MPNQEWGREKGQGGGGGRVMVDKKGRSWRQDMVAWGGIGMYGIRSRSEWALELGRRGSYYRRRRAEDHRVQKNRKLMKVS